MSGIEKWVLRDGGQAYDIDDRVFRFGVNVVKFVRTFTRTLDSIEIGRQLMRSGTSVGANMEEADGAASRRDFVYKVGVSRKEARESRYWIRLCLAADIGEKEQGKILPQESDEIVRILSGIITSAESKTK